MIIFYAFFKKKSLPLIGSRTRQEHFCLDGAPKPPSDEGGVKTKVLTEGEKKRDRRIAVSPSVGCAASSLVIKKPDKKLKKLFIAQSASGFL